MASTPEIRSFQAGVSTLTESSPVLNVSQAGALILAIWPAEFIRASGAGSAVVTEASTTVQVVQAGVMVVGRGRVNDPAVRVWGFPLDNHEYYIIRLGNAETLVVDISTGQFYVWGSGDSSLWRAYDGCTWLGGTSLGAAYGSNIVAGDDGNGSLYFLDPEGDADDDALQGDELKRPFRRVATGQMVTKGYQSERCYGVYLLGSIGQLSDSSLSGATLSYSDDRGNSYVSAGEINVPEGEYHARLNWRSLGSIKVPGRLFRVTDTGALRRIDSLEMSTGPGQEPDEG